MCLSKCHSTLVAIRASVSADVLRERKEMTAGRNDPCPCGSGKKHKKCCLATSPATRPQTRPSPRFRFEAGSYGGAGRQCVPSAICYEQIAPGEWRDHFCLVNPSHCFDEEDEASAHAETDLNAAAGLKSTGGSDADFAMSLKDKGYVKVDDFERATD